MYRGGISMNFLKKFIFSTKADAEKNNNLLLNELLTVKEMLKNIDKNLPLEERIKKALKAK